MSSKPPSMASTEPSQEESPSAPTAPPASNQAVAETAPEAAAEPSSAPATPAAPAAPAQAAQAAPAASASATPLHPPLPEGWTPQTEMEFYATVMLNDYKPAGLGKHFHMALILDKMYAKGFKISRESAWQFMDTLYDMEALDHAQSPELAKVKRQLEKLRNQSDEGGGESEDDEDDDFVEFSLPAKEFRRYIAEIKARSECFRHP